MINWKKLVDVIMVILTIVCVIMICIGIVINIDTLKNCSLIQVYINDGEQQIIKKGYWVKSNVEDIEIYVQYSDGTLHKYIPENKENAA